MSKDSHVYLVAGVWMEADHESSVGGIQSNCVCSGIIICADVRVHDFDLCNVCSPDVCTAASWGHIQQLVQGCPVTILLAGTAD